MTRKAPGAGASAASTAAAATLRTLTGACARSGPIACSTADAGAMASHSGTGVRPAYRVP